MLGAAATVGAIGLDAGVFKGLEGAGATTGAAGASTAGGGAGASATGAAGASTAGAALAPLPPALRAPLRRRHNNGRSGPLYRRRRRRGDNGRWDQGAAGVAVMAGGFALVSAVQWL